MKTGIAVGDAMTHQPVYVSPQTNLKKCAEIMKQHQVGSLLVKENRGLVGIFTEGDMVRKALVLNKKPEDITARDIMAEEVVTISPDRDIFEALQKMKEYDVRHLPVVDSTNNFVGILTDKDIIRIQPQLFDILVDMMHLRAKARKTPREDSKEGNCHGCGEYSDNLERVENHLLCPSCLEDAE